MLQDPIQALIAISELLICNGKLAMLNPSENLTEQAALKFADERQMDGFGRATLLNWARRAVQNSRWSEAETAELYRQAGLIYGGSVQKIGPGFGRFSWGLRQI